MKKHIFIQNNIEVIKILIDNKLISPYIKDRIKAYKKYEELVIENSTPLLEIYEKISEDGISSWMLAVDATDYPFHNQINKNKYFSFLEFS